MLDDIDADEHTQAASDDDTFSLPSDEDTSSMHSVESLKRRALAMEIDDGDVLIGDAFNPDATDEVHEERAEVNEVIRKGARKKTSRR